MVEKIPKQSSKACISSIIEKTCRHVSPQNTVRWDKVRYSIETITNSASVALSRISCCEKRHLEIVIGKYVWELWSCKKYISHVCKRDEPSGQLRIYYSGTMPKQKDNLRGD